MTRPLYVEGMHGLGDNIMQRALIRRLAASEPEIFLRTPWPELYADLPNVWPVRSQTSLRTQAQNERRSRAEWVSRPARARVKRVRYGDRPEPMMASMERHLGLEHQVGPILMDLPPLPTVTVRTLGMPIALVRPVTIRREWQNESRNPLPEYVNRAAERLARTHFVIAIADLADGEEWLAGPLPVCDMTLLRGELTAMEALALLAQARVVVGGVGWIVPAALAAGTPAFIYLGGNGGYNSPRQLIDPRVDLGNVGFSTPDRFCLCKAKAHPCDKRIRDPIGDLERWAATKGIPL